MASSIIVYLSSCICLLSILYLIKLFNRLWWIPTRIQAIMGSQGIRGPGYRLVYGNTKEILSMRNQNLSSPMGMSHDIFPRIQPHIHSWIKQYGMNFLSWYGSTAQLVVTEPDMVKDIMNNKDGAYPKTKIEGYVKKLVGDSLVTSQGEKWFKLRKLANHAFHSESLKILIPEIIGSVEMMLERWRQYDGKEIEVSEEFTLLASEVISRTAFGSSYLEGENIFNMLTRMADIISRNSYKIKISLIGKFVKTSDDVESDKIERELRACVTRMMKVREEKAEMGNQDGYGNDFFGLLMKAHKNPHVTKKISVDDIVDECKAFYIAGHETTANLLAWTVLLLAIHQDWQEKARNEVLELFGQENPKQESIGKLKNLGMIINESLRLYSPAVTITRRVDKDGTLGKLRLVANMEVSIPILALHHSPQIWGEDAHLFKPERFAGGVAKATNNNPSAFLPFGSGPRICVGLNFATTEAKIALSMILQRYKFNLSPNYVHSPFMHITVRPQHGVQVMLQSL